MTLEITTGTLFDFVAGKEVFYLDGRMYYFLTDRVAKPSARGAAWFAYFDVDSASVVLRDHMWQEVSHSFDSPVTYCEDVGLMAQEPGHRAFQRDAARNKLHRYAYLPRADLRAWTVMKRVVMGVVDYKVMRDNQGLTHRDRYGVMQVKSEPSVTRVAEGFGRGQDAWVLEFLNDDTAVRAKTLVLPADSPWWFAGPHLSFSSEEHYEAGAAFV